MRNNTNWDVSDDFSLTMGSHTLKAGSAFLRFRSTKSRTTTWAPGPSTGTSSLTAATPRLQDPDSHTASFRPCRGTSDRWIQGYVQEEWRIRPSLTVDLGLRYETL
jgi:outer membrane receptor protein involved in Fe transport